MAVTISSEPVGMDTSIDPVSSSRHLIKVVTLKALSSGFGVISSPSFNLTNRLQSLVTRVLCQILKGKSIDKGDVSMFNSPDCHNNPACPSVCPCMEQEYILSEGYKVDIEKGKEVNHDFVLDPSPFKDCGTLSGRVRDKHCNPIKNALVKVFDLNHDPITHVFTNKDGEYLICLPAGHYLVKAVH